MTDLRTSAESRNSSIELLQIIAMFMILMHHFIVHNTYDVENLPLGPKRVFFQLIMQGGGKIGVVIFFSISAWFFLDKEQNVKTNFRRVWIMERELLFWSITLAVFYLMFDHADTISRVAVAKNIVPLTMNIWWYATSYAIFLMLLPFLLKGLKALGRECHLTLAAITLIIWGLTRFFPGALGDSALTGVFGFIYLFILISAYKWYMKPFALKQIWLIILFGLSCILLYAGIFYAATLLGHSMNILDVVIGVWSLPVIMIGFGMFLLFNRITFHNRIVNYVAQSAFAVYLITDHPFSRKLLWTRLFNLQNFCQQPFSILKILGILLAIYITCTLLDFVRQALFAITIDRHRGNWFNLLWNTAHSRITTLKISIN